MPSEPEDELEWMKDALCQEYDTSIFFPAELNDSRDRKDEESALTIAPDAVAICWKCKVDQECLEYALHRRLDGIWAGTTPYEREQMQQTAGITIIPFPNQVSKRLDDDEPAEGEWEWTA